MQKEIQGYRMGKTNQNAFTRANLPIQHFIFQIEEKQQQHGLEKDVLHMNDLGSDRVAEG